MLLLAVAAPAEAAEVRVLSGNGARAAISELGVRFERASGHKVAIHFEVNPAVKRQIEAGEAFDVASSSASLPRRRRRRSSRRWASSRS
jgi:ABC-type molybdate transport system substrate-binding protein